MLAVETDLLCPEGIAGQHVAVWESRYLLRAPGAKHIP